MVKRVFYIEKEKFLRSMLEIALRAKGAEVYTVESLSENFYLIEDQKPDLVIFDLETCLKAKPEELEELYAYSKMGKLLATGGVGSENSVDKRVSGFLPKPLVANSIADRILSLID